MVTQNNIDFGCTHTFLNTFYHNNDRLSILFTKYFLNYFGFALIVLVLRGEKQELLEEKERISSKETLYKRLNFEKTKK